LPTTTNKSFSSLPLEKVFVCENAFSSQFASPPRTKVDRRKPPTSKEYQTFLVQVKRLLSHEFCLLLFFLFFVLTTINFLYFQKLAEDQKRGEFLPLLGKIKGIASTEYDKFRCSINGHWKMDIILKTKDFAADRKCVTLPITQERCQVSQPYLTKSKSSTNSDTFVASIADHETIVLWENGVPDLGDMLYLGNYFTLVDIADKVTAANPTAAVVANIPKITKIIDVSMKRNTRKKPNKDTIAAASVYTEIALNSRTAKSSIIFQTPHQYALWMGLWAVKLFKIACEELEEVYQTRHRQHKDVVTARNRMLRRFRHLQVCPFEPWLFVSALIFPFFHFSIGV
jgi:hypothetical protein